MKSIIGVFASFALAAACLTGCQSNGNGGLNAMDCCLGDASCEDKSLCADKVALKSECSSKKADCASTCSAEKAAACSSAGKSSCSSTASACSGEKAAASATIVNANCPYSGKPVKETLTASFNGQTIGFCCGGCKGKWESSTDADRQALLAKSQG